MQDIIFQDICFEFEVIDSTNLEAKRKIEQNLAQKCFIITAKSQTNGRGRNLRKWHSENTGNIYTSFVFEGSMITEEIAKILPLYTAFSILKAIKTHNNLEIKYKWPNDLLIDGKKFCGILIEKYKEFYIIGIGVNTVSFPNDTVLPATSLSEFGITINLYEIFESFKQNANASSQSVINLLSKRFFTQDEISIDQGKFVGTFFKITNEGYLVLRLLNGTKREISFGEVCIL